MLIFYVDIRMGMCLGNIFNICTTDCRGITRFDYLQPLKGQNVSNFDIQIYEHS